MRSETHIKYYCLMPRWGFKDLMWRPVVLVFTLKRFEFTCYIITTKTKYERKLFQNKVDSFLHQFSIKIRLPDWAITNVETIDKYAKPLTIYRKMFCDVNFNYINCHFTYYFIYLSYKSWMNDYEIVCDNLVSESLHWNNNCFPNNDCIKYQKSYLIPTLQW